MFNFYNYLIFGRPVFVWLGLITLILLILQILVGTIILKLPFFWHKKIIWVALLTFALLHAFYGIWIYFIK